MSEYTLVVHPFEMGTGKESALKPLEEAAEVFGAWQRWVAECPDGCPDCLDGCPECLLHDGEVGRCTLVRDLADELSDCIQACCNLAARYGLDLGAAMKRCEERNRERGRYE